MKKSLWILLLVLLSFFIFLGISQAGQCIYLFSERGNNFYYNPSDVRYSGDIVYYVFYDDDTCTRNELSFGEEIDCARRMVRAEEWEGGWEPWRPISPGSFSDRMRIRLCR